MGFSFYLSSMGLFGSIFGKKEFKAIKGVQVGEAKGQLIAQSESGQLFAFTEELMDVKFLKLMIVSNQKFRSFSGGTVHFKSQGNDYTFESDLSDIQSMPEDGLMVTEFDVEWNDELNALEGKTLDLIIIKIGKAELQLNEIVQWPIQLSPDEEE